MSDKTRQVLQAALTLRIINYLSLKGGILNSFSTNKKESVKIKKKMKKSLTVVYKHGRIPMFGNP